MNGWSYTWMCVVATHFYPVLSCHANGDFVLLRDSTEVLMCHWLLKFGADVSAKDRPFGRQPLHYAEQLSEDKREVVLPMLERHAYSPTLGGKLFQTPPPHGFEEFFAKRAKDPQVVNNCEDFWLRVCGAKSLRTSL